MSHICVRGPDGAVLFSCTAGSAPDINAPPPPAGTASPSVPAQNGTKALVPPTFARPASYDDCQRGIVDLHDKTMQFFMQWTRGGGSAAATTAASAPADEEEDGALDLDACGEQLLTIDTKATAGQKRPQEN